MDDIVNAAVMQASSPDESGGAAGREQNETVVLQQGDGNGGGGGGTCKFGVNVSQSAVAAAVDASEALASRFRRSGSERLRDGAKAILRRVESLKTRRRKQRNRDGIVIGSPQVLLLLLPLLLLPLPNATSTALCSAIWSADLSPPPPPLGLKIF